MKSRLRTKFAEVYSQARVTAYAGSFMSHRIEAGMAYDIKNAHDMSQEDKRDEVLREIDDEDVDVAVLSPPYTKF